MKLLSNEDVLVLSNGEVTSELLFIREQPDPNGLFSESIFGSTKKEQFERFGHIELNCKLLTPTLFENFVSAYRKQFNEIIAKRKPYIIKDHNITEISEEEIKNVEDQVYYGLQGVYTLFYKLRPENTNSITKKKFWDIVDKYKPDEIFIIRIPVIPLQLRPYRSKFEYDTINDVYINIIKLSKIILNIDKKDRYRYGLTLLNLQLALKELYDQLKLKTGKHKTSLMRSALLGKRLDFSARTVVTVDPKIPPDYMGIPVKVAVNLFEPWLIRELINNGYSIDKAVTLVGKISKGYHVSKEDYDKVLQLLQQVIKDRYVVVKRDPNLHRGSIRAFKIVLVEDNTTHVNPVNTEAFGMDFDGDTAALYTPLSEEALEDVKKLFNMIQASNPRTFYVNFTQDVKGGICLLTKFEEKQKPHQWWLNKTKVNNIETTEGRKYIYDILPKHTEQLDKHVLTDENFDINFVITSLVTSNTKQEEISSFIHKLILKALSVMTIESQCISIKDLTIADISTAYKKQLEKVDDINKQQELVDQLQKQILKAVKQTPIGTMIECGIVKTNQLFQLLGVKGIVQDPDGKPTLINENFAQGLKPTSYFTASFGSRNGIIYRTNKTALTGYSYRKTVYALASAEVDPNNNFCGTKRTIKLDNPDEDLLFRLINRYALVNKELTLITAENYKELVGKSIELYSPIYCKSKHYCTRCYGEDYKLLNSTKVGFIAAAALSERLTQNMLKAFHEGGIVKQIIPNFFKEIVNSSNISEDEIKQLFDIVNQNKVVCKQDIKLDFSKEYYNLQVFNVTDDPIPEEFLYAYVHNLNKYIVFDSSILLYPPFGIEKHKQGYTATYNKGSTFCVIQPVVSNMENIAKKAISIMEGRTVIQSEQYLFNKLFEIFRSLGNIAMVHIEVLISQILRNADDPSKPARLVEPYNPKIVSIKQIPYLESWIRGLEFENFDKAVTNALLTNEITMQSDLDAFLT